MSTPASPPAAAVEALDATLAAEHAAVYAYGVIGAVVDPAAEEAVRARACYEAHRARRDRLEQVLRELGAEPVAAEPGYALPAPVTGASGATRLAVRVEDGCAAAYAGLVSGSAGRLRDDAVGWLSDAAVRALDWGAPATAFPGLGSAR